ncbi:MAG TPA: hypothetical protein VLA58_04550, partial [Chitinophagaceae bacterium]|nr:hypothetical protein [Chitinophagaceae bacterium]
MKKFRLLSFILPIVFLLSCAKDYSDEGGGGLGRDCRLSNITAINDLTGAGEYALNTRYDITGRTSSVELYDSVLSSVDY